MTIPANTALQRMTYREACKQAIRAAILADKRVFLMGEDVARYGGCYAVTKGLAEELGEGRILDTPLSEAGYVGAGIGAAIAGMRPIVEIMTVNFSLLVLDQIVSAKIRRPGHDVTLVTYGGSLFKALEAAEVLQQGGIDARGDRSARAAPARHGDGAGLGNAHAAGCDQTARQR